MRSSCRKLAALIGAILLAGELAVGVLGVWFPRESQMYMDFYIEGRRDCWLAPGAEAEAVRALAQPEIDPAAFAQPTACYVFEHGWNAAPPWNQTTQAKTAWLNLPRLPGATVLDVTLANTSPAGTQVIWVRLNAGEARRLTLPPGQVPVDLRLLLPAGTSSNVQLRFLRPHEPDGNPMAVLRLKWIE